MVEFYTSSAIIFEPDYIWADVPVFVKYKRGMTISGLTAAPASSVFGYCTISGVDDYLGLPWTGPGVCTILRPTSKYWMGYINTQSRDYPAVRAQLTAVDQDNHPYSADVTDLVFPVPLNNGYVTYEICVTDNELEKRTGVQHLSIFNGGPAIFVSLWVGLQ